jgi:hypothetical protein
VFLFFLVMELLVLRNILFFSLIVFDNEIIHLNLSIFTQVK